MGMLASAPNFAFADDEQPSYKHVRYLELGDSIGSPAGNNIIVGYWWGGELPLLVQLGGMYYGPSLNGVQLGAAYAFDKRREFNQYLGLGLIHSKHIADSVIDVKFTGVGPYYGLNWDGFALEAGVAVGKGTNTTLFPFFRSETPTEGTKVLFQIQLGYRSLFRI